MKYRLLGDTSVFVSRICLGTMTFGGRNLPPYDKVGGLDQATTAAIVDTALEAGVNFVDTRLQTDRIDLYQIHNFDPFTPFEEVLRALDDAVRQGKVRYISCSNLVAWQIVKALGVSERRNLARWWGWRRTRMKPARPIAIRLAGAGLIGPARSRRKVIRLT
ncbi:aldo/keto reductase [Brevundimonas diminuta]|uniref:aldo/keto reductase n=1 Tax=Brevundimonas diminuta TaxID=293 RepID=UPI003D9AB2B6